MRLAEGAFALKSKPGKVGECAANSTGIVEQDTDTEEEEEDSRTMEEEGGGPLLSYADPPPPPLCPCPSPQYPYYWPHTRRPFLAYFLGRRLPLPDAKHPPAGPPWLPGRQPSLKIDAATECFPQCGPVVPAEERRASRGSRPRVTSPSRRSFGAVPQARTLGMQPFLPAAPEDIFPRAGDGKRREGFTSVSELHGMPVIVVYESVY